jgi:uncharacterized RmlC-like cupin family protein
VYSNQIQPGATAGMHYHKQHQVAIWMRDGELEMTLEDIRSKETEVIVLRPGSRLLLVGKEIYHSAANKTDAPALAIMFATTPPRDPTDEWSHG